MKYTTWLHVQENICDKGSLLHTILPPLHNILLCQYECMTFTYKNGDLDRAQCLQNAIYRSSLEGNYCYCFDDASFQGAYNCTLNNQIYFSSTLIIWQHSGGPIANQPILFLHTVSNAGVLVGSPTACKLQPLQTWSLYPQQNPFDRVLSQPGNWATSWAAESQSLYFASKSCPCTGQSSLIY